LARSAIDIHATGVPHMISIPGECTVDFVLEAITFELQGLLRSPQFGG